MDCAAAANCACAFRPSDLLAHRLRPCVSMAGGVGVRVEVEVKVGMVIRWQMPVCLGWPACPCV